MGLQLAAQSGEFIQTTVYPAKAPYQNNYFVATTLEIGAGFPPLKPGGTKRGEALFIPTNPLEEDIQFHASVVSSCVETYWGDNQDTALYYIDRDIEDANHV